MGACSSVTTRFGVSAEKAFEELCDELNHDYGCDPYNGTLSNCSLIGRSAMTFDKPTKENEKKAYNFAYKDVENLSKRVCRHIDLGIDHYEITTVKKVSVKGGKPDFKKMYVVNIDYDIFGERSEKKSFKDKKSAEEFALKKQLENRNAGIWISHEYVLISGASTIEKFETTVENKKSLPRGFKATATKSAVAIHKYIFYGMCPE